MIRMTDRRWLGGLLTCVVLLGCPLEEEADNLGAAALPIRSTGPDGAVYELQNATFDIEGPTDQVVVTADLPDDAIATIELTAGVYTIGLRPGWVLHRTGGNEGGVDGPVEATVASANPLGFTVLPGASTPIRFEFEVGDARVIFEPGSVDLGIDVTFPDGCDDSDGDGLCDEIDPCPYSASNQCSAGTTMWPVASATTPALTGVAASAFGFLGDVDADGDVDAVVRRVGDSGLTVTVLLNDGAGEFTQGQDLDGARALAIHDLDEDGVAEIVAYDASATRLQLWRVNTSGVFEAETVFMGEFGGAANVWVADLDAAPGLDLLLETYEAGVLLLSQAADGSFSELPSPVSGVPQDAGDVDGDGDVDLLADGLIWLNDGGSFAPVTQPNVAGAFGDLDGDGDLDLFGPTIYFGEGDGRFTEQGPGSHNLVALGDIDLDGDLDAFVNAMTVLENDGTGQFTDTRHRTPSTGLGLADLDGDLDLDSLAIVDGRVVLLQNEARPEVFRDAGIVYDDPSSTCVGCASVGDIDADGRDDLAAGPTVYANEGAGLSEVNTVANEGILLRDVTGDGTDDVILLYSESELTIWADSGSPAGSYTVGGSLSVTDEIESVDVGDANGDGLPDLWVFFRLLHLPTSEVVTAQIFLQQPRSGGSLQFDTANPIEIRSLFPVSAPLVDIDGDGDLDLGNSYENDGTGVLTPRSSSLPPVAIARDFDGDGLDDIWTGTELHPQTAPGTYGPGVGWTWNRGETVAADFDGDGDADVATQVFGGIMVWENDGSGSFAARSFVPTESDYVRSLEAGDMDADGRVDLVIGLGDVDVRVYLNTL